VSLRLDAELSALENTLLDAHLGRCESCRAFADDAFGIAWALRDVAPESPELPVVVAAPARPRQRARVRALQTAFAAALVLLAAALGSALNLASAPREQSTTGEVPKPTAMLAVADTPDQLRKLRRPGLVESGNKVIPRNRALPGEIV
jgi:predicted anti-sigma-YlaC factor YlaD